PASATVDGLSVVARDGTGLLLTTPAFVAEGALHVLPPTGGWPAGATLALHPTLLSEDGRPLVGPILLPLTPP
ncbi:MAG: hypothetical protein H6825_16580, partial [Planctomycetes bacterium]|nr:hypothetical protein [Planctomycetota bacterium]